MRQHDAAFEFNALLRNIKFGTFELGDEIIMPIGPAVFAVGRGAQADRLLFGDCAGDAGVLDGAQGIGGQRAGGIGGAGFAQFDGAQQTADVIGTEWGTAFRRRSHGEFSLGRLIL